MPTPYIISRMQSFVFVAQYKRIAMIKRYASSRNPSLGPLETAATQASYEMKASGVDGSLETDRWSGGITAKHKSSIKQHSGITGCAACLQTHLLIDDSEHVSLTCPA